MSHGCNKHVSDHALIITIHFWCWSTFLLFPVSFQVRCLKDHGEFEIDDGTVILLKKNSQVLRLILHLFIHIFFKKSDYVLPVAFTRHSFVFTAFSAPMEVWAADSAGSTGTRHFLTWPFSWVLIVNNYKLTFVSVNYMNFSNSKNLSKQCPLVLLHEILLSNCTVISCVHHLYHTAAMA